MTGSESIRNKQSNTIRETQTNGDPLQSHGRTCRDAWRIRRHFPSCDTCDHALLFSASRLLKAIKGTANPTRSPLQHVRINHRCGNIGMAQQLLHGANVSPAFKQVRRETVTKRVTTRLFDDP